MARHVQHVVDTTGDGEVACFFVTNGAIASQVVLAFEVFRVVALDEARIVTPDGADHGRPWALHNQNTTLAVGHVFAGFVHDGSLDAGERQRAGTGHHGCHAWQRGDHVTTGFGLPEGVDDWATAAAHMLVVPLPCSGVDGLAHRTQQAQAGQVIALGVHSIVGFSSLDERADCRGSRVENAALVILDHLPETTGIGVSGHAFEHDFRAAQGQGAIGDVGVACDPADVGGTPEHVVGLQVERPLGGQCSVQQVTACAVLNTFWLAGGTGGVQQEQRMLCRHPLGFACGRLASNGVFHPHVTAFGHGNGRT